MIKDEINLYDQIILKDGRRAIVHAIYGNAFLVEILDVQLSKVYMPIITRKLILGIDKKAKYVDLS